jgi:hypothetical protein
VNNRFQNVPFKRNLHRYTMVYAADADFAAQLEARKVGRCTLNQVDP